LDILRLRSEVFKLACRIAQEEVDTKGIDYKDAIDRAIDKACLVHGLDRKAYQKLFN
jgi:hypothetical protein